MPFADAAPKPRPAWAGGRGARAAAADDDDRLFDVVDEARPNETAGGARPGTANADAAGAVQDDRQSEREGGRQYDREGGRSPDRGAAQSDAPDRPEADGPTPERGETFLDFVRRRAAASRERPDDAPRPKPRPRMAERRGDRDDTDETLAFGDPDTSVFDAEFEELGRSGDAQADGFSAGRVAEPAAKEPVLRAERDGGDAAFGRRPAAPDASAAAVSAVEGRALAPIDAIDEAAERVFNEAFFKALRVQPKDLERAIRRARRRAESREKNRLTPARAAGWALWVGVVGAAGYGLFAYRENVVEAWPQAEAAYDAVGLEVSAAALAIEDVAQRLAMSTQGPTLEVTGRLANRTAETLAAPRMQVEAVSAAGDLLARWTFDIGVASVPGNAATPFTTRARAPEGVAEIFVSFAPAVAGPRVGPGGAPETAEAPQRPKDPASAPAADEGLAEDAAADDGATDGADDGAGEEPLRTDLPVAPSRRR
ncbi:MAG: hypothetical protein AAGC56_06695 [Pseudomonadota bacterium]